jgi:hypothetical protein
VLDLTLTRFRGTPLSSSLASPSLSRRVRLVIARRLARKHWLSANQDHSILYGDTFWWLAPGSGTSVSPVKGARGPFWRPRSRRLCREPLRAAPASRVTIPGAENNSDRLSRYACKPATSRNESVSGNWNNALLVHWREMSSERCDIPTSGAVVCKVSSAPSQRTFRPIIPSKAWKLDSLQCQCGVQVGVCIVIPKPSRHDWRQTHHNHAAGWRSQEG